MGEPWGNDAKWNNSDREGQLPYSLTCVCNIKQNKTTHMHTNTKLTHTQNGLVVARDGE